MEEATKIDTLALAKRINRDRLDRRMTWPAYAAWMGVKQSTLYKIAQGSTTRPHALTVDQIVQKLNEPIRPEGERGEVVSDGQ